jgi:hypothetical protein
MFSMSQIQVLTCIAFLATLSVSDGFITTKHQHGSLHPLTKHTSASCMIKPSVHMSVDALDKPQDLSRKAFVASSIVYILTLRQSFAASDEVSSYLPCIHGFIYANVQPQRNFMALLSNR